jgi:hypothetical protein
VTSSFIPFCLLHVLSGSGRNGRALQNLNQLLADQSIRPRILAPG